MIFGTFGFVMMVLFLSMALPLWIIFHYITKWKMMNREDQEDHVAVDKEKLLALSKTATSLKERIVTLERLLDAEAKGWREK